MFIFTFVVCVVKNVYQFSMMIISNILFVWLEVL